ncbi:hypothetical protein, partial [Streptomyces seoulensis]|uniref:hypothetical protein n=1 Tax=Streptomyces seoulensis TaxID=73044 RepID=UPI0033B51097
MRMTSAVLVGAVVLTLAGCGAGQDDTAKVPATATGSLESLAAEVKCRPDMQTDADEIRQALCKNADGKFVLATFATDRGQREWINDAKDYGGLAAHEQLGVAHLREVVAEQTHVDGVLLGED